MPFCTVLSLDDSITLSSAGVKLLQATDVQLNVSPLAFATSRTAMEAWHAADLEEVPQGTQPMQY